MAGSTEEPEVSIVVPAYREAARLPQSLAAMIPYFQAAAFSHEVLIIVEHSGDGTLELARQALAGQANFRVVDNRVHRGKGYAVRSGMRQARGRILFYMDADLSVPLEEIDVFLAYFRGHPEVEVLLGNRQHQASRIERRQGALRQKMGQTFNHILRLLAPIEFRDTQCGFKALRRAAAQEIFRLQTIDGFAFDVEVLLLARALGCQIRDLPVRWLNSPASHVRIVHDSLQMLRDAISVRRRVRRILRYREFSTPAL